MVINNERALTETRQFLEQNVTQDCNVTLDTEINLDCCEIVMGIQEYNKNPCDFFYTCDKNNFHCILSDGKIGLCGLIIAIFLQSLWFKDLIKRKLNNLFSKLQRISGRRTEANSMEMN